MIWRLVLLLAEFLVLKMTVNSESVEDWATRSAKGLGRQILIFAISIPVFLLGLSTMFADLLLASNLRGEGQLRVSQVSALALVAVIVGALGFYRLFRTSRHHQTLPPEVNFKQSKSDPTNELAAEMLRMAVVFIREKMAESKKAKEQETKNTTPRENE
jgi:uncharacterized membrane protein